ncbi:MAG: type I-MYXAN CRISPR-associated protein Cas6/Cmx6 [Gammaproteobacteria bacterium]
MPYVDLAFRLSGATVPVDHGYALYSALSRVVSEIHSDRRIGVQPIRGVYAGDGTLHLAPFSRLILRLPDEQIRTYLTIAGKKLEIDSHPVSAGAPQTRALRPVARLRARLVTIKGFLENDSFLDAANRQLEALGITGHIHLGERRTLRVKDKQVVGFEVAVSGLTAEESLTLQEKGLGGRRRMGCGMFVPWRG